MGGGSETQGEKKGGCASALLDEKVKRTQRALERGPWAWVDREIPRPSVRGLDQAMSVLSVLDCSTEVFCTDSVGEITDDQDNKFSSVPVLTNSDRGLLASQLFQLLTVFFVNFDDIKALDSWHALGILQIYD